MSVSGYTWNPYANELKDSQGTLISQEEASPAYQAYVAWLAEGNSIVILDGAPSEGGSGSDPENTPAVSKPVYYYVESEQISSTNSTNGRVKVNLPVTLEDGFYKIEWQYTWAYSSTSSNFRGWVLLNDASIFVHEEEPQDASSKQLRSVSGFRILELKKGSYNIDLVYGTSNSSSIAYISQARLLITGV